MSKFLDVLERIRDGESAPLGFAAARAQKLPGIALVGLVSKGHAKGIKTAADASVDALFVSGAAGPEGLKKLTQSVKAPWGAQVSSLTEEEAQSYQDSGSDLLVFNLDGTAASALASQDIARILCVDTGIDETELRTIASLPVDAFLISMKSVAGPWTLRDLATLGFISRRVDKYILVEVSQSPGKRDLEALRDVGVSALVMDVGSTGAEGLSALKTALLEMPRPTSRSRQRRRAILPGSAFSPQQESEPEPDQGDGDDDDYE
ncbi:MAG: hypothetical protein O2909_12895 [Chloroflexi bacterium]|nr:hypothetical protein [Chloroflexota bacterium]MDA1220306.1 hypothetical protein [Chloroflexota bacterium]